MTDRPPATVVAYVVKWVAIAAVAFAVVDAVVPVAAATAVLALLLAALWNGSRAAWAVLLAGEVAYLASLPVGPHPWWAVVLVLVGVVLLLAGPTRAHVAPS